MLHENYELVKANFQLQIFPVTKYNSLIRIMVRGFPKFQSTISTLYISLHLFLGALHKHAQPQHEPHAGRESEKQQIKSDSQ